MRIFIAVIGFWALLVCGDVQAAKEPYKLKAGDLLRVSVWGEEQLTGEIRVLPDGSISFPLVGRVEVTELNVTEVEQRLEGLLDEYIPAPDVSVSILQPAGNRIYVVGNVEQPGVFGMSTPLTVMQALALAGGLTTFADASDIKVLRDGDPQITLEVDYPKILAGKRLETNHALRAGDTILVP
jgi:polysaccharide export outer membrane protein